MEEAFYGVNVQSTLALGEARGVALFVAAEQGLAVTGYPPATVKQAVVGHGRATKQQVGYLVRALLALRRTPEPDAADALAIAICHARRQGAGAAREEPRVIAFLRGQLRDERRRGDGHRRRRRRLPGDRQRGDGGAAAGCRARSQLFVHTHFVKDEPLRLYGFATTAERRLFQTLISVQGVGPRVALAILAGIEADELVRAIATGDVNRLTQIKGVGRKIAERLALELREKILTLPVGRAGRAGGARRAARRRAASPAARWARSTARWCSSATSRSRSNRCSRRWTRRGRSRSCVREALAALRRR